MAFHAIRAGEGDAFVAAAQPGDRRDVHGQAAVTLDHHAPGRLREEKHTGAAATSRRCRGSRPSRSGKAAVFCEAIYGRYVRGELTAGDERASRFEEGVP